MKLVLELGDLATIFSRCFNQKIEASSIEYDNNPFGITINGLTVTEFSRITEALTAPTKDGTPDIMTLFKGFVSKPMQKPEDQKDLKDDISNEDSPESVETVTLNEEGEETPVDMSNLMRSNRVLSSQKTNMPNVNPITLDSEDLKF